LSRGRNPSSLSILIDIDDLERAVPVHGSTLLDTTRVARALKAELPTLSDDAAAQLADAFRQIADQDKFDHGNFPLFTFNATTLTGPEASRRLELMADTFGSYYLTHLRGGHVGIKRVKDFVRMFYELGGCQFTNVSHHGTPGQRRKAAELGAVNALVPATRVLPSRTLDARFEKALCEDRRPGRLVDDGRGRQIVGQVCTGAFDCWSDR
jgi:hypothetical protein